MLKIRIFCGSIKIGKMKSRRIGITYRIGRSWQRNFPPEGRTTYVKKVDFEFG